MRIAGGAWRGRTLRAPEGESLRPTQDAVREAVFSMLSKVLPGTRFLDLYAGTGAVGLEALSRGAASAVWVEQSERSLRALRANVAACLGPSPSQAARGRVVPSDVRSFLRRRGALAPGSVDVVYADPPYVPKEGGADDLGDDLRALLDSGFLAETAFIALEQRAGTPVPESPDCELICTRRYGRTQVSLYRAAPPREKTVFRRLAVFDLDGTLLDTLGDLRAAVNFALMSHGLPERSPEQIRMSVGSGVRALVARSVEGGEENALFDCVFENFKSYYAAHAADSTAPYAGVKDALAALRRKGFAVAVVSNKPHAAVQKLVELHFSGLVDVTVGETPGVPRKPAPDMVHAAVEKLRELAPGASGEIFYVGDSDVDLQTARNSGLPCISVLWGFRTRGELAAAGACVFAETPDELAAMLSGR